MSFVSRNHPQQVKVRGALSSVDDRGTDPVLFAGLNYRFGFTIDVAASHANTKVPESYITAREDGLVQSWAGQRVWCNPPYSDIGAWIEKAWWEWYSDQPPQLIVMLLPANRTEQRWWHTHVEPYRDRRDGTGLRVEFLKGRQRFVAPGAESIGPNERPPFGCCLLIWEQR